MRYKYDNYIASSPNRAYLATVLRTSAHKFTFGELQIRSERYMKFGSIK